MLTEAESKALCDAALSRSQAGDASVEVRSETTSHARFADNSLTTSGRGEDVTIRVTAWVDRRRGTATTNEDAYIVFHPEQIMSVYSRAFLDAGLRCLSEATRTEFGRNSSAATHVARR